MSSCVLRSRTLLWPTLLFAAGHLSSLLGQTGSSSLLGTVTDTTSAIIPATKVTVTNRDTNVSRTLVTNDVGDYEFPFLAPGTYNVQVEKSGFATYEVTGIYLGIRETGRVNVVVINENSGRAPETRAHLSMIAEVGVLVDSPRITETGRNRR